MTWYRYTLTARSRVSAGSRPESGNHRTVHEVLPGSVVRGALATAWAREHDMIWGDPTQGFTDLFERSARFGQAVPAQARLQTLARLSCKYPTAACTTAVDAAAHRRDEKVIPPTCPGCKRSWDTGKGWKLPRRTDRPGYDEAGREVRSTRTQLTRFGVSDPGRLFSRSALGTSTSFYGRLFLPDGLGSDWIEKDLQLRVGGQRSLMGSVAWSAEPVIPTIGSCPARAVLTVLSPTILLDDTGAATLDPSTALRAALGGGVQVIARWVRPVEVGGWHAASNRPKPADWALAAGSVFVLDGLPEDAGQLLLDGLGLRRLEGFGHVELSTPDGRLVRWPTTTQTETNSAPTPAEPEPVAWEPLVERIESIIDSRGNGQNRQTLRARLSQALHKIATARIRSGTGDAVAGVELQQKWVAALDAGDALHDLIALPPEALNDAANRLQSTGGAS